MVNFGLNSASILGIFLAVAGAGLYFLRSVRPELSRDHDIFFAAVGLLCGLILLFQGWRLDPILQFGQFLLTGSAIFFAVETIRLRGVATEQARRNTPIVDEERRVSKTRVYTEAELDQIEPYEDEEQYDNSRRLRGYPEPRTSRSAGYGSEEPRSSRSRRPAEGKAGGETPRKRRPRPPSPPPVESRDSWETPADTWEERPPARRPRPDRERPETPSRPSRKPRPASEGFYSLGSPEPEPTDYVDYQPIEEPEGKGGDWDQEPQPPSQESPKSEGNEGNPVRFDY